MSSVPKTLKCIAVHPFKPYLAIAGTDGFFSIWNYMTKQAFEIDYDCKDQPTCMEYTPNGENLIVCYFNGFIRFFNLVEEDEIDSMNPKAKLVET